MTYLNPYAVVTKVFDVLRIDSRTSHIDWAKGERNPPDIQKIPAGDVFSGPGRIIPVTMPAGEQAPWQVIVRIYIAHESGVTEIEQLLCDGVDLIGAVLLDTIRQAGSSGWDLGLDEAFPEEIAVRFIRAPATNTAYAEIILTTRIIPTGS